jgi:hypothetical protein
MNRWLLKAKTLFTALPIYLVAVAAVVTILSEEIASVLPSGAGEAVGRVVVLVLAVLTAAGNIVRRVSPPS